MKLKDLFLMVGLVGLSYVIYRLIKKKYIPQKDEYCERVLIFSTENSPGISVKLCANTKEGFEGQLADMLAKGTTVIRLEKL